MIPPPTTLTAVGAADWIELCCFRSTSNRVSRSDVLDNLNEYLVGQAEAVVDEAWHEMSRRSRILGKAYPAAINSPAIELRACERDWAYRFMLLLSQDGIVKDLKIRDFAKTGHLFERLVTPAVKTYVGGSVLRIGHPRETPVPKNFTKLLAYLGPRLGEGPLRSRPLNPDTKDCKADILAWRPFADNRGGKIVLFVQCASSAKRRRAKLSELSLEVWARYIEFTVSPLRGYAVPFIDTDDERWLEDGSVGGIAFDRLRIQELLAEADIDDALHSAIVSWSEEKMKTLVWAVT